MNAPEGDEAAARRDDAGSPFAPGVEPAAESSAAASSESGSDASGLDAPVARVVDPPPIRYQPAPQQMGFAFNASILVISFAVLGASFLLDVANDAIASPIDSLPLPGLCTFKRLTGMDCPGCGLTRSFVSISHGRIGEAWSFNPSGFFLYGILLFQIPYRAVQLNRIRKGLHELDLGLWGGSFLVVAAGMMLVQWAVRTSIPL